mmetsp:Transcript_7508/g.7948  ORF Transcript_7508/g.7948 Transcript_7508/m.7948 type:complete len:457 (+) Transcript_7508:115-1485(+)
MSIREYESITKITSYDGQIVWGENRVALYEVGNFLGGGAAGTVYEAENIKTKERFALKILNPIGYKMLSPALLRRCTIISKGKPISEQFERSKEPLTKEHVWWVLNGSTKQHLAAYYSERQRSLNELSLLQCIQIWGSNPQGIDTILENSASPRNLNIPIIPPKYVEFVRKRDRIFREINNMRKISPHINVIRLEHVLELAQDSKCTIFLVMELANGGELFDRIKIDCGTREKTAKKFFLQLLAGVRHCHDEGVCHRDLKPENLLLSNLHDDAFIKLADFGFAISSQGFSTLKTQCGTPGYVAPEILSTQPYGKAVDMWSIGVITYILLGGYPPFQHTNTNKLFQQIRKGKFEFHEKYWSTVSDEAKNLIEGLLRVDTETRLTVDQVLSHPWLNQDGAALAGRDLMSNLAELRKYQATRKFKAAANAVIAINRMNNMFKSDESKQAEPVEPKQNNT